MIRNLATDEIVLKSRRAAWRERKEAQKRDTRGESIEADKKDRSEARVTGPRESRTADENHEDNSPAKENVRRKVQAEFY